MFLFRLRLWEKRDFYEAKKQKAVMMTKKSRSFFRIGSENSCYVTRVSFVCASAYLSSLICDTNTVYLSRERELMKNDFFFSLSHSSHSDGRGQTPPLLTKLRTDSQSYFSTPRATTRVSDRNALPLFATYVGGCNTTSFGCV